MTALAALAAQARTVGSRLWNALAGAWGAILGVLPHVLHHVGPLAGAALLAGAGGKALFGASGFVAAIPFLVRLYGRLRTWVAPATALALFVVMFSISSFVIGPLITGGDSAAEQPGIEQPAGHAAHHP